MADIIEVAECDSTSGVDTSWGQMTDLDGVCDTTHGLRRPRRPSTPPGPCDSRVLILDVHDVWCGTDTESNTDSDAESGSDADSESDSDSQ